tara:strand:+ start:166 stop:462 length:297 start_codon:yes stop_codon:yes gene_type:complete
VFLAFAERLRINNDLVFSINGFHTVIALDCAFTGRHFPRLIIGNITFYLTTMDSGNAILAGALNCLLAVYLTHLTAMDGGNAGLAGALACLGIAVFRN